MRDLKIYKPAVKMYLQYNVLPDILLKFLQKSIPSSTHTVKGGSVLPHLFNKCAGWNMKLPVSRFKQLPTEIIQYESLL